MNESNAIVRPILVILVRDENSVIERLTSEMKSILEDWINGDDSIRSNRIGGPDQTGLNRTNSEVRPEANLIQPL